MKIKYGMAAIFVIIALSSYAGSAPEEESLFSQANSFYEKGEYAGAVAEYQKILDDGEESAAIYYNMANTYFKSGSLGKAIVNYKRAIAIDPRDADIIANYRFAQSMIKETVIPKRGLWAARPLRIYAKTLTINELLLISSGLYVFMLILLFIAVRFPFFARYTFTAAVLIFVFLSFNIMISGYKISNIGSRAVVTGKQAEVLFGPFDSATKFFTLNEGMEVKVLKKKDDWYKVRRADGKAGWLKSNEVEIV